jgi:MarR family transcriptional regulator, organic hydroperoxide resistance regulator
MQSYERLHLAFRTFGRKAAAELSTFTDGNVSGSQLFILDLLVDNGPLKISDLATHLKVTLSAITNLSDKLVKSKHIVRERCDDDRRVVRLVVTQKGKDLVEKLRETQNSRIKELHKGLTEEEIETLISIYNKLSNSFD